MAPDAWIGGILVGVVLWSAGCSEAPPVALEVNGLSYSHDELGLLTESQRSDLATLAAFGLAISEGRQQELAEPFVERDRRSRVLRRLTAEVAVREAGLTEDELRARYRRDPAFELEVRHLLILSERWESEAERQEARGRAAAALVRARGGEDFAALAASVSEEPGAAERGGLLRPGREGAWVDKFWEAAAALEEGEISDVVETEYGFHVIRLEDRRVVPFAEMRNQVLARLVDMDRAMTAARAWAARATAGLRVDTAAIRSFNAGGADTLELARWEHGRLTASAFRGELAALEPGAQDRLSGAPAEHLAQVVAGVARNRLLAERAGDMGLDPPEAEVEALREESTRRVLGWAAALGLDRRMEPDRLGEAAMEALSASQQIARLARGDVLRLRPLLEGMYRIRIAPPASGS